MKVINLLPKNEQKETKLQFFAHSQLSFWIWTIISLTICLILVLAARFYLNSSLTATANEVANKREILKSSDNELLKQQVEGLNRKIAGINNLQKNHVYWSTALAELARLFASDIQLDFIFVDRPTGKIEVQGVAANRDSALKFWADLQTSLYFKDINFPLSNLERATNGSFTFTFFASIENLKQPLK
ncbi:MAG: hypothetical protein A3B10_03875 [Candidatus Doudnabacteria bacterium RIFCSPLOWO2_01_FULL_44_21]|uniref:PilN domain-containing protein n=1 Tax=Candidatus Doudnabacteria bacterium RIFCSPLOWO2_01_FULL_44_21 TaxID=1817841 RepID=A0A1F5PY93_9BACT|nr:MAG: hypothetical protein A3B95_01970 [Candidatus Doudnabacteria bacterium RIFCSPHIGHO2_02_FULL_43_13b]OGE94896.1 MAG: hypothetical protein A3B10_03875 [Candidatus Doudnabacteria bacterium RIFCSPLOWO2_01_FULL_44_21]